MTQIPVVFVSGLAADGRLWQPVLDRLSDVVAPTVAKCEGASIEDWADEILASAPQQFYIAGISMGGYVALEVALRGDARLAGVILLNTNARSASAQQRERGEGLIDEVRKGNFAQVVERLSGVVSGGKAGVGELAAVMTLDAGAETFVRQQQAVLSRADRREQLPRIAVPTLVIAGDEDRLAPPSLNNELARLIPSAELEILACGHMSTAEAPAEVADIIRRWLVSRRPGTGSTKARV